MRINLDFLVAQAKKIIYAINPTGAVPLAPYNLSGSRNNNKINLTWQESAGQNVTTFTIQKSGNGGSTWKQVAQVKGPATSYQDSLGIPGFVLRASSGDLHKFSPYLQKHPLLKHVIIEGQWSSIETSRGVYNVSALKAAVSQWCNNGYKVILNIYPYIQLPSTDKTNDGYFLANGFPTYLYNVLKPLPNGLLKYTKSDGSKLAVPVVYSDPVVLQRYTALMQYLAGIYDGNPCVSFVLVAQGDIGHLAIGPTEAKANAVSIGFTNQLWADYGLQLAKAMAGVFLHTPLAAISEKGYFGDTTAIGSAYGNPWLNEQLAGSNVSIIENKMETLNVTDPTFPNNTDAVAFFNNLDGVNPSAVAGTIREGYGADWPLWVPVCAQTSVGTVGHDYNFASTVLNKLLGPVPGHVKYGVTLIMANPRDMMGTNPNNPATTAPTDCSTGIVAFDPTIYQIYLNAYSQLLANAAGTQDYRVNASNKFGTSAWSNVAIVN